MLKISGIELHEAREQVIIAISCINDKFSKQESHDE